MKDNHTVIGFDAKRIVRNATGLGNYGRTLVNNIMSECGDHDDFRLYAPDKGRDDLRQQITLNKNSEFVYPRNTMFGFERSMWRMKDIVRDLKRDKVDIYHGLTGELPIGLRKSGVHGIVTIHDLIFLRYPQYYHWLDTKIYAYKFRITCREAERIIAISECTKRDIVEFGHVNPDKIKVIYQGCDDSFKHPVDDEKKHKVRLLYGLPMRYILNVGSIEERKNVMLAVKALHKLPDEVKLVIVGKQTTYTNQVLDYIDENNLHSRVLIISNLSFEDLPAVYQMAETFVYPSRYEGFGIPIIEAINSGVPVVACTGSCLEEAGGPHSLYVSPDDTDGMAEAVNRSLKGMEGREERITKSKEYVQRFENTDTTEEVIKEYRDILNQ